MQDDTKWERGIRTNPRCVETATKKGIMQKIAKLGKYANNVENSSQKGSKALRSTAGPRG